MGAVPEPSSPTDPRRSYLNVQQIYKRYAELEVLKGVSLEASQHEVVSLIGASGSGKSTLLRCINLLAIPDRGRHLDRRCSDALVRSQRQAAPYRGRESGAAPAGASLHGLPEFQSVVAQDHPGKRHGGPVQVLKAPKPDTRAKAEALLERVGIAEKRNAYPSQLSGGQQQRAAIARALCMEPKILLFDEPTSALDPELVGEVLKVMRDLALEGRTMLVVSHEMSFVREVSNKVIFLHQGRIAEAGTPAELFLTPKTEPCQKFLSNIRP